MTRPKLPITAIVASHDEAALLPACLDAISFCDELVVIDIASSDETAALAEAHGARVVRHPWVPIAEQARLETIRDARHDWLLIRDPDEVVPPALADDLFELFPRLDDAVAVVAAPTQRYFGGRPLEGGVWGGVRVDRLLARRGAVEFPTSVHTRLVRKDGFRQVEIPPREGNAIRHEWAGGYRSFLERHLRYLRLEGPNRAAAGEITGWRAVAATPWWSFRESFVRERGYRDGLRGLALSTLWALYRTGAEVALLRELRRSE